MDTEKVILGLKYKDDFTGFTGVATAKCTYVTGPDRVMLECLRADLGVDERWFDVSRVKAVG